MLGLTAAAALLQLGPPLVLYCALIAPKSLLILVSLGSAFYWATTVLLISALLRGFLPLGPSVLGYASLVSLAVIAEEAARYGLWLLHRRAVRMLQHLASKNPGWTFLKSDEVRMAFAAGFGHAAVHMLVFSVSWLGLTSGKGVLYTRTCTAMSFAPAAAYIGLGFFFLHCGSMVMAFDGLAGGRTWQAVAVAAAHLAVSLLTVLNVAGDSCVAVTAVEVAAGCAMLAWAALTFRTQAHAPSVQYAPIADDE